MTHIFLEFDIHFLYVIIVVIRSVLNNKIVSLSILRCYFQWIRYCPLNSSDSDFVVENFVLSSLYPFFEFFTNLRSSTYSQKSFPKEHSVKGEADAFVENSFRKR